MFPILLNNCQDNHAPYILVSSKILSSFQKNLESKVPFSQIEWELVRENIFPLPVLYCLCLIKYAKDYLGSLGKGMLYKWTYSGICEQIPKLWIHKSMSNSKERQIYWLVGH